MSEGPTVAVLGTGIMGAPMARCMLEAGLEVRAWNRTRERAEPLAGAGAEVATTPAEATRGAGVVVTILADGPAVREVMIERGGLEAMSPDAVWLQMSTVGVDHCEALGRAASEAGVGYVDAPVIGTKKPAEDGALIVLASGPRELELRCKPVLDAVGKRTIWCGEAGAGSRLKLVVNNWIVGLVAALGESVALAEALEVDPAVFLDAIAGGPIGPPYADLKGKAMIAREMPASFPLRLALKDARLVIEAARARGLDPALAETVAARFAKAVEQGHGDEDMAAVYYAARE